MEYKEFKYSNVTARLSEFVPDGDGIKEYHGIFTVDPAARKDFRSLVDEIYGAVGKLKAEKLPDDCRAVFCRYFLSDASNQAHELTEDFLDCASSVIEQPPLDGSKIALWVYWQENVTVEADISGLRVVSHGAYRHLWLGDSHSGCQDSELATRAFLYDYARVLSDRNCSLLDNCLRTWFFVRDVDVNYKGVVVGRNNVFDNTGLTRSTHYIASTGIGGRRPDPSETVAFNAYSVEGLKKEQVKYLKAESHLNPTMEYGVAFERGTTVEYGDRRHTLISGTASINNRGEIVHPGDIINQTRRMWENVEALLSEADSDWNDVAQMIVYLRDIADYRIVGEMYDERFPGVPCVIVHAPVCRPGWLIEMECMAVRRAVCEEFAPL